VRQLAALLGSSHSAQQAGSTPASTLFLAREEMEPWLPAFARSPRKLVQTTATRLRHRAAVCRAAAPESARTHFSGIDDGDGLDLDHEIGSGETGNADGRAGRGRHPEIAHADVGASPFVMLLTPPTTFSLSPRSGTDRAGGSAVSAAVRPIGLRAPRVPESVRFLRRIRRPSACVSTPSSAPRLQTGQERLEVR
jgi:hypothetical protein